MGYIILGLPSYLNLLGSCGSRVEVVVHLTARLVVWSPTPVKVSLSKTLNPHAPCMAARINQNHGHTCVNPRLLDKASRLSLVNERVHTHTPTLFEKAGNVWQSDNYQITMETLIIGYNVNQTEHNRSVLSHMMVIGSFCHVRIWPLELIMYIKLTRAREKSAPFEILLLKTKSCL